MTVPRPHLIVPQPPALADADPDPGASRHADRLAAPSARRRAAAAWLLLAAAAPCAADQGAALQYGRHGEIHSLGVQWLLPVWYRAGADSWRISSHPELQFNQHRRRSEELLQTGAFATIRLSPARVGPYPYIEAGVGVNFFSRDRLGPKHLSTRFQFGELLGAGVAWGGRPGGSGETSVGLRFLHYSNAGLRQPNNGIEAIQFVVSHRF